MRGKLTIFLGYAAGVGKTYSMLMQAKSDLERGEDVVIGYVEMHKRENTLKMMEGIEMVEPLIVNENGISLRELDIKGVIKRKPKIVLIDELAHSNPSNFKNSKRYLDVEEILNEGIDVYTTVNIQHLESLNDVIYDLIKVRVKEKVPDYIFDKADSIKVIDVNIEELQERLLLGKIYQENNISRAMDNFFKYENLEVLREICLRKSADIIGSLKHNFKEVIVVLLSSSPSSERVLRDSKKIASAFHGDYYALYVDNSNEPYPDVIRQRLKLASDLGASVVTVYGESISNEIVEFVKRVKATKVVVGNSVKTLKLLPSHSLIDELSLKLPNVDIYVIPNKVKAKKEVKVSKKSFDYRSLIIGFIILLITIILGFTMKKLNFNVPSILLLYILSLFIYTLFNNSYLLGISFTLVYMLSFNYFHTTPYFSLQMDDASYPLMLILGFVISLTMTTILKKIKEKSRQAQISMKRLELILNFSKVMQNNKDFESVLDEFLKIVRETFKVKVCYYKKSKDRLKMLVVDDESLFNLNNEKAIAQVAASKKIKVGRFSKNLPASKNTYYPLAYESTDIIGVLGIHNDSELTDFNENLLLTYINYFAQRVKNLNSDDLIRKRDIELENEKFKSTLLRSISHDLKTPLTGISGNCQLLLKSNLKDDDYQKLEDISKEANWLMNMVENILTISKLQEKNYRNFEVNVVSEIINSTLEHVSSELKNRKMVYEQNDDLLLVNVDARLLEQVFINIINNAIEHTSNDGKIGILVSGDDNNVIIDIYNEGARIPNSEKDKIFDLFYSTKTNLDSKRGSGLGLYISKSIINYFNGTLVVNEKYGSVNFEIKLKKVVKEIK